MAVKISHLVTLKTMKRVKTMKTMKTLKKLKRMIPKFKPIQTIDYSELADRSIQ